MFNNIFNKNQPDFWKSYKALFKNTLSQNLDEVRFIVFDTETTGLDIVNDRILSIGAISVFSGKLDIGDSLEIYLKQKIFKAESVEIHGILKEGSIEKHTEEEAIISFLKYIENGILVAHHAAFDIAMINAGLRRMGLPKLKNKVLDTGVLFKKTTLCEDKNKIYSLDYLSGIFKFRNHDRHTSSGDAFLTGMILLKILSNLKGKQDVKLNDLFFNSDRRGLL
ncbi:PolC-type DNA polymerase III [Maribacter sp. HTCC2170]|uniref:3'-5' exonuclease n=1 Tax=Maribacter sp. (strain HTCC2170 / KCCM 42371) TaxID=313603 RepID=UPI00006B4982|nr:3'-5' exonuclease [Maribacter sp. HTCC2170]EAR01045.1 DNA polymerase III, epsilon subunit [Maribacter sp. HTCC2170]